jgi:uncharacterized protein YoaH (UPF0181 family)
MLAALKIADTPLSHAFRHIEPTWRNYIYYANQAAQGGDPNMKKFMDSYNALPRREQQTVMPDKLCDLSGVSAGDLIAAVSKELWNHKQGESTITASVQHPKVIERTAYFAQAFVDNNKDRELFLRATGSLPDKKGAGIGININFPQAPANNLPSSAGMNGFRPMDQSIIEMSKLLDEPADENVINLGDAVPLSDEDAELVLQDSD